jgi:hypothetical protein
VTLSSSARVLPAMWSHLERPLCRRSPSRAQPSDHIKESSEHTVTSPFLQTHVSPIREGSPLALPRITALGQSYTSHPVKPIQGLLGISTNTSLDSDHGTLARNRADDASAELWVGIIRSGDDDFWVDAGGLFNVLQAVVQAVDYSAVGYAVF